MEMMMAFYDSLESRYGIILRWQEENMSNFEEIYAEFGFLTKKKRTI